MGDQFTKEEMLQALVNCGMNLDVKFLESHIGERGLRLSDGQKQRVSLARAILRKPQLLVLDEALSGVDAETESLIFNKIKRLIPYIIVISHRLSTILQCSGIYVLHDGRFVDSGLHEELLNSCTLYRELIKEQIIEKSTTGSSNEK